MRDLDLWNDPDRLEKWTLDKLEELDAEHDWLLAEAEEKRDYSALIAARVPVDPLEEAKKAARLWGDLGPLRKRFPAIAEFLCLPRRKRGEHRPEFGRNLRRGLVQYVFADVERIKELWRVHFGRSNRSHAPTALAIAAKRHGFDPAYIVNLRKNQRKFCPTRPQKARRRRSGGARAAK